MHRKVKKFTLIIFLTFCACMQTLAQTVGIDGYIVTTDNRPVEYASILVKDGGQWATSDEKGYFVIKGIQKGSTVLIVQCLGYKKLQVSYNLAKDMHDVKIVMKEDNLKLQEVEVVAKRSTDDATTSYTVDKMTLDNQQIVNLGDITSLLPGGQTTNGSLINDNRISLRSGNNEKGNASFGTAIEVDGVRLDNNASSGETTGSSLRSVSTANIESVEIITGIPSVEYGDLSNGVVKVNTRKGRSPYVVEGRINQHTRQIALSKGFDLGRKAGIINTSFEHARSFSDAASPHTAYQRNVLYLNYSNTFMQSTTPLTLNVGMTGNVGGYNSKSDPDNELDNYSKARDNSLRVNFDTKWLLNKSWITNLSLTGVLSVADKKTETYTNTNSASTQPYIHALTEGYNIAEDYDVNPTANIILGPTGYWYVKSFTDSKPMTWQLKLKGEQTKRFHVFKDKDQSIINSIKIGVQWTGSRNNGRGVYYDDMRYAPTWREYRYDEQPSLHNIALYIEDKVHIPLKVKNMPNSAFELIVGLRDDITMIKGSDYGNVNAFSPRFNGRYILWRGRKGSWIKDLSIHAGWGKSVKLPSFQVLYPSPSYSDHLTFASTSTKDNTSYYAYHTYPSRAVYNSDLRWQYTNQTDIGAEFNFLGTRITLSAFHHRTYNPYMATNVYTPFTYHYTSQAALQTSGISAENRNFTVDSQTGVVTVSDATGVLSPVTLAYSDKNTYVSNLKYVNASPIDRYGLEWIVDFPQIKPLRTEIRVDGKYYYYKGIDETLFAAVPVGLSSTQTDGNLYSYIGYYRGGSATSTGYAASATVNNGSLSKQLNLNATITTHIPKIRLIVSLRLESTLYRYSRALSESSSGSRGYILSSSGEYFGTPYDGSTTDKYIAIYPEYYSTWDDPDTKIPFYEKFVWAYENDQTLYNDLCKLVVKSNYPYTLNPNRISAYYSANFTITKEIGDHVSISFYANNFFNNMKTVTSSQTGLETSLFSSGYIPSFYYGLALKLKL